MEGTYPLPEAQLDRFFFKLLVKLPDRGRDGDDPRPHDGVRGRRRASRCCTGERILEMSRLARQIPIADEVRRYGIAIVMATHPENEVATRDHAAVRPLRRQPARRQALILGAKIRAILDHRYHVAREDLRAVAASVLRHRLILNFEGQAEGVQPDAVVADIMRSAPRAGRGGMRMAETSWRMVWSCPATLLSSSPSLAHKFVDATVPTGS